MDYYVYYSKGTNHGQHDDVAICQAECLAGAVAMFREYFSNVTAEQVHKVDLHRAGYAKGIMILSDY